LGVGWAWVELPRVGGRKGVFAIKVPFEKVKISGGVRGRCRPAKVRATNSGEGKKGGSGMFGERVGKKRNGLLEKGQSPDRGNFCFYGC